LKLAWRRISGLTTLRASARIAAPLILLVGIVTTLVAENKNQDDHASLIRSRFLHETDRILSRMAEDVRDLTSLRRAAQAALGGGQDVDGTAWWRFSSAIDFANTQPSVRALAYVRRVDALGVLSHAVQFSEPVFGGASLPLNGDLQIDSDWREAARWAAEDGFYIETEQVEPSGAQRLILPIYVTDEPPRSLEERRASIKGWVLIDFDLAELFSGAIGQSEGLIRLGLELDNGRHIRLDQSRKTDVTDLTHDLSFFWVGLKARVHFAAFPEFGQLFLSQSEGMAILITGVTISVLLALMAQLLIKGQDEAQALAKKMSQEALTAAASARVAWQHLSDAIEAVPEGFVLWDPQDRLLLCNSRYREMYAKISDMLSPGVTFAEVAAQALKRGQHPLQEEDKATWLKQRIDLHTSPSSTFEQCMHDGRWVLVSERKTQDGGTVGIRSDITAVKQTQAKLVQASKLATLGEMATGIAHELNQPLTIMRLAAESAATLLRKKGAAGIDAVLEKQQKILRQIDRAASITNHMRVFGRESAEENRRINLTQVVEESLGMIGEQLKNHNIEVRMTLEPELYVSGNAIRLEQVLLNLLGNARDAVEARERETSGAMLIEVSASRNAAKTSALVRIADNGGGIDPKILERIFDPFFTTKAPGKGTGLGLSISYGIVRDMGGQLEAANACDGAVFTLALPLVA
jgi:signal transduction histidine kinase